MFFSELIPGVSFAILTLALLAHHTVRGPVAVSVMLCGIILVVRSHPLALLCLGAGLLLLLALNREAMMKKKRLLILLSAGALSLLIFKALTLNPYDASLLYESKGFRASLVQLLHPDYALEVVYYLIDSSKTLVFLFICTTAYFIVQREYKKLLALLALSAGLLVIFNLNLDFTDIKLWDLDGLRKNRWSLPIRFVVFFLFFYHCIGNITSHRLLQFSFVCLFLLLITGTIKITEVSEKPRYTIKYYEKIIDEAHSSGCRKCIMDIRNYDNNAYLHRDSYFGTLILSSLENPDSTIQVLFLQPEEIPEMRTAPPDEIRLMDIYTISQNELRKPYFTLPQENYGLISVR